MPNIRKVTMERKRPTPYKVLADEIGRSRHPYRVWPHNKVGDPCNDCGQVPINPAHRHLEYLLWEAGLLSAEEVFDPLRGYWNPVEAQAEYMKRVEAHAAASEATRTIKAVRRDAQQAAREEAGATSWTSKRRAKP